MTGSRTLIVAATSRELETVPVDWESGDRRIAGRRDHVARDGAVVGLATGVGPTDAAMRVAAALDQLEVGRVLTVGIAGALPGADVAVGDAVVGTEAVHADLGRAGPEGFVPVDGMGIADDAVGSGPFALAEVDASGTRGAIASVSTVSATDERATRVAERTGAVAETMETAAVARVGTVYGVEVAAVAGVANRAATDRGFDAGAGLDGLRKALAAGSLEVAP